MAGKLKNTEDGFEQNPSPMAGTTRRGVDAVLGLLKAGNGVVSLLSGLLASALILYSGYVLYDNFATQERAYSSSWELLQYKPEIIENGEEPSAGAETLAEINRDYRGWLTIYDSSIDYPVVQGENDLYYASHDIYQNTSLTGAIYLAAGNSRDGSDSYNLIYGHHMDNGAMFGALDRYRDSAFYQSHREGILVTESSIYDLTAFAVVNTDAYEHQIYSVGDRAQDVVDFLTGDRSQDVGLGTTVMMLDETVAGRASRILALSTCDDAATSGRLVVMFRMTPRPLPTETPEPTAETTVTPTVTVTPTATATVETTVTPTVTVTPTATATVDTSVTPGATASPNVTALPTATATVETSVTPGATVSPDATVSPTATDDVKVTPGAETTPRESTPAPDETPTPTDRAGATPTATTPATAMPPATATPTVAPNPIPGQRPRNTDVPDVTGTPTAEPAYTPVPTNTPVPGPFNLEIRYEYLDGREAFPTWQEKKMPGEEYSRDNPTMSGYITARKIVHGTMGTQDVVVVVLYIPEEIAELGETISIEDYEVSLGLDALHAQMGICIE